MRMFAPLAARFLAIAAPIPVVHIITSGRRDKANLGDLTFR